MPSPLLAISHLLTFPLRTHLVRRSINASRWSDLRPSVRDKLTCRGASAPSALVKSGCMESPVESDSLSLVSVDCKRTADLSSGRPGNELAICIWPVGRVPHILCRHETAIRHQRVASSASVQRGARDHPLHRSSRKLHKGHGKTLARLGVRGLQILQLFASLIPKTPTPCAHIRHQKNQIHIQPTA